MNGHERQEPVSGSTMSARNERVLDAVKTHRRKIQVLTGATLFFGFLTIATSVVLVWAWLIMVLPRQKQMMQDREYPSLKTHPGVPAELPAIKAAVKRIDGILNMEVEMTHVVSVGLSIVCVAVGLLGLGTIIIMAVMVLQRRATLNQISASLAKISERLKQLQPRVG